MNARDKVDEKQNIKTALICGTAAVVTGVVSSALIVAISFSIEWKVQV